MTKLALVLVAAAACKSSEPEKPKLPPPWYERSLETVRGAADEIGYTIQLPVGMTMRARAAGASLGEMQTYSIVHGRDSLPPHVTIHTTHMQPQPPPSPPDPTFTRHEMVGDASIVTQKLDGKDRHFVVVTKPAGDRSLVCSATVAPWPGSAKLAGESVGLVEAMCLSLAPAAAAGSAPSAPSPP